MQIQEEEQGYKVKKFYPIFKLNLKYLINHKINLKKIIIIKIIFLDN